MKKHQKIFIFVVLIVAIISIFDILSMSSGIFSTSSEDYISGNYSPGWWPLFFKFNLLLIGLISFSYYWFGKHDKSESISLAIGSFILWYVFGLADFFFFIFQRMSVPSQLVWLNNGMVGKVSSLLGFSQVTNIALYVCVLVGLIVTYSLIKCLSENM